MTNMQNFIGYWIMIMVKISIAQVHESLTQELQITYGT